MQIAVSQLNVGDLVRFTPTGRTYRLHARDTRVLVPGLMDLTFATLEPMTMPRTSLVHGVSLPRHVYIPCLLCKQDQPHLHNLVDGTAPRACVCSDCNTRTEQAVFAPTD